MKQTLRISAIGLTLSGILIAGPAEDIAKKHEAAKAAELEAYLKENPEAKDKAEAQSHLLEAYELTGDTQKSIGILKQRFDALVPGDKLSPRTLFMTTRSLFDKLIESGDEEAAKKLLEEAGKKSEGSPAAKQLSRAFTQMANSLNRPEIGDSMELKFTSLQGEEVDLAAMKGKVVLVDFWATWCGPCINELPNVIKAYEKYHDKGFEIIAISLDDEKDKAKLENFIKENNMPWPQHYDGKGWENKFAQQYGISGIPATFLIGPDGKVVAKDLRGEALEKEVAKHLPKEAPRTGPSAGNSAQEQPALTLRFLTKSWLWHGSPRKNDPKYPKPE